MSRDVASPGRAGGAVPLVAGCLAAVGISAFLDVLGCVAFRPYFGEANPIPVLAIVAALGVASLIELQRRGWFTIRGSSWRGPALATLLAVPFLVPVIMVDFLGGFPADINVGAPESLLFYPVIALVAEFVFHVVPLGVLLVASEAVRPKLARDRILAWSLPLVALIEPSLQVMWGSGHSPVWVNAYVGLHVFVFNLIGLQLFRRYGFFTMYAFRLTYYLLWHVLWGYLRLPWLFAG